MAKTREIECWVDVNEVSKDPWAHIALKGYKGDVSKLTKARLIIDLPEKKIEITESQFDEAWKTWDENIELDVWLKQKLFGEDKK